MRPQFDYGEAVRVVRNVRNDGTYPGLDTGTLLVRRGSVGHVVNVGTFLQDQIIYTVHFLDAGRMIGCREEELIDAEAPWVPNLFEFRDRVTPRLALAIDGETIAEAGEAGEIEKVLRDAPGGIHYHLRINGRTLLVPEGSLAGLEGPDADGFCV